MEDSHDRIERLVRQLEEAATKEDQQSLKKSPAVSARTL
jgi:hypothetical protein